MTNSIAAAIQAALGQHQAGNLATAEQMYRDIIAAVPGDAGVINLLGVALFQQNRLQEAAQMLGQAIALNPNEATFHFNLGNIAKALGQAELAESSFRTALKLRPHYPEATKNLCNLLDAQGRYRDELLLYRAATSFSPDDPDLLGKLYGLYDRQGEWAAAATFLEQILISNPQLWNARLYYARALHMAERAEQAIAQYRMFLEHNPQNAYAHYYLAELLARRGERSAARHHLQSAIRLAPNYGRAQVANAGLLLDAGSPDTPAAVNAPRFGETGWVEQAVQEILNDHYGNAASFDGWLFATLIDHRFFDGSLNRMPVRYRETNWPSRNESGDVLLAANEHLTHIASLHDKAEEQYAALERLAALDVPALTQDSFPELNEAQTHTAIREHFSHAKINILIIGGGPSGLVLASALKLALHDSVSVLVVDNRASALHHKLPYDRRWTTNIPRSCFGGLIEAPIDRILENIGRKSYIGVNVNALESLLLLSCRRLGVKFLFAPEPDLSFIEDSGVQFVFDASGNRFQPKSRPSSPQEIHVRHSLDTSWLGSRDELISGYGIKIHACEENRQLTLGECGDLVFPLYNNLPVKLAMLKVTQIPVRLYESLLDYIARNNPDNKYYIWPARLPESINQAILIINLDRQEYEYLCRQHVFPMKLDEALQTDTFGKSVDARTSAIFGMLKEHASSAEHERINIEAPFLFEPFLVQRTAQERLYGKPLIRIGDSIYNGNMKRGNGLGSHLVHLRHIQTVFRKYAPASANE